MKVAVTPRGTLKFQVFWVEKKKHEIGLIGGTFDRFHAGHMSLISAGLANCEKIQVWITNDNLARSKDQRIQDWYDRESDLIDATSEYSPRITTHQLDDNSGHPCNRPRHQQLYALLKQCRLAWTSTLSGKKMDFPH